MASAEREPITDGGAVPSGVQGAEPPVGIWGWGEAPLKLNAFLFLRVQRKL